MSSLTHSRQLCPWLARGYIVPSDSKFDQNHGILSFCALQSDSIYQVEDYTVALLVHCRMPNLVLVVEWGGFIPSDLAMEPIALSRPIIQYNTKGTWCTLVTKSCPLAYYIVQYVYRPKRTWKEKKRSCKKIAKHVIWTRRMLWSMVDGRSWKRRTHRQNTWDIKRTKY